MFGSTRLKSWGFVQSLTFTWCEGRLLANLDKTVALMKFIDALQLLTSWTPSPKARPSVFCFFSPRSCTASYLMKLLWDPVSRMALSSGIFPLLSSGTVVVGINTSSYSSSSLFDCAASVIFFAFADCFRCLTACFLWWRAVGAVQAVLGCFWLPIAKGC